MRAAAFAALALLLAPPPGMAQPTPAPPPPSGQPEQIRCAATPAEAVTLRGEIAGRLQPRAEGDQFIAYDDVSNRRIWMFTTEHHPAHPSIACIEIVSRNGTIGAEVRIGCFASAANCAILNREFEERGARVRQALPQH